MRRRLLELMFLVVGVALGASFAQPQPPPPPPPPAVQGLPYEVFKQAISPHPELRGARLANRMSEAQHRAWMAGDFVVPDEMEDGHGVDVIGDGSYRIWLLKVESRYWVLDGRHPYEIPEDPHARGWNYYMYAILVGKC
ncbi:MAG: hypothetical protein AB7S38_11690 [Vulcanimicrobiota bacterium]